MEVALYVRVSTTRQQQTQTIEQQMARLREHLATHPDWHLGSAAAPAGGSGVAIGEYRCLGPRTRSVLPEGAADLEPTHVCPTQTIGGTADRSRHRHQ
jgi:hypothetical protein